MTQPTPIRRVRGHRPRLLDLYCCAGRAALATLAPALEVAA
jgi:DNA (cytosine-5)-methyltransferase 1